MRYVFGKCTLDTEQYVLYRANLSIALQPKVFQVLHYLLMHRDRVIAKSELSEQVWPEQFISDATLEGVIKAVRQAVDDDGRTQWCIQTRRGQGYRFVASLVESVVRHEDAAVSVEVPVPVSPTLSAPISAAPPYAVVETSRRQLTVLFCDLADSTPLAVQLDPEDLREVMLAYYAACAEVAQRFDGTIVQYLGDGLLIFFGYPQAHEDEAQQAIHTGLGILEAITTLNTRLQHDYGVQMAARLGIHTGMVIVGRGEEHGGPHPMAFGDAPNIASRLQNLAHANQVVISEHTRRLAGGGFDYVDLGVQALRGVATPIRVYGVRGTSAVLSRFEIATGSGLSSLVGREEEVRLVLRRWEQAQAGEGQVILLAGEAGIGKSRLVRAVREALATAPHTYVPYQCLPHYRHSAFYSLGVQLEHAAQFARHDTVEQKLDKLERLLASAGADVADVAPLFAAMLSLPTGGRYLPLSLTPERQRVKTIEALVDQIVGLAARRTVLCIVEDAQWSDPTTLEVLDSLVHRVHTMRALVIVTYRPEFTVPWRAATHVTALTLNRLDRAQSAALVEQVTTGKVLPAAVLSQIVAQADGMPLFVEELTKAVLESEWLLESADGYELLGPLPLLAIPSTLQDTLTARLDRLGTAKAVAQLAATIGREFSVTLLQAVLPADEDTLQGALTRLVEAEIIYPHGRHPDTTYIFKHALIQGTAYHSLLRKTRQGYHRKIAQVLVEQFAETVAIQPEILAHHYTEAGLPQEAVVSWQLAGKRAIQRSAHAEAIAHLTKGLAVLQEVPETPERFQCELTLYTSLGAPLLATKGYAAAEVGQVFRRARELCQHVGDSAQLFHVLQGLWGFYIVRADLRTAFALGEQLYSIACTLQDEALLLEAAGRLGISLSVLGRCLEARHYLEQGIALYEPSKHRSHAFLYGQDPQVASLCHMAWCLWLLGYPDQALRRVREALALAQELSHPHSLAFAHLYAALVHQLRRERGAVQEQAEALIALCSEQGFQYRLLQGRILQGWALVRQGDSDVAITQMQQSLEGIRASGAEVYRPYFQALLAEAYGQAGQPAEGLTVLSEIFTSIDKTGERFYEAGLCRLQGELLLQLSDAHRAEAATCFQHALDMARRQQAKSLELEAAISLGRLWQHEGRRADAYQLLTDLHGWFREGFDTENLQHSRALCEQLA